MSEGLKAAFAYFDVDSSGKLSRDELKKILVRPGATALSPEVVDTLLQDFDKDGDGEVSMEEYLSAMNLDDARARVEEMVADKEEFVKEWEASTAKQEERLAELLGWQKDFMTRFRTRKHRRAHWRSAWNYYMHDMPGGPFQTRADLMEQYLAEIEADPAFDALAAKIAAGDGTAEGEFTSVMEQEEKLEVSGKKLNQKIRDIIAGPGAPSREEFILENYADLPADWEPPNPAEWTGDWLSHERLLGLGKGGEYPRTSGPTASELETAA